MGVVNGRLLAKSPLGKMLDDERVSEGNTTKTGGEGSDHPTPRTGGGALRFPGHPARPLSPLFYDGTQSRLPEGNLRCNTSKLSASTFGGNGTEPLRCRG